MRRWTFEVCILGQIDFAKFRLHALASLGRWPTIIFWFHVFFFSKKYYFPFPRVAFGILLAQIQKVAIVPVVFGFQVVHKSCMDGRGEIGTIDGVPAGRTREFVDQGWVSTVFHPVQLRRQLLHGQFGAVVNHAQQIHGTSPEEKESAQLSDDLTSCGRAFWAYSRVLRVSGSGVRTNQGSLLAPLFQGGSDFQNGVKSKLQS